MKQQKWFILLIFLGLITSCATVKNGTNGAVTSSTAEADMGNDERLAKQQAEAQRLAREKAEAERLAREQAEAERLAREKAEAERLAREKAEAERLAREKAEAERLAREKAETQRLAKEQAEAERLAREKAEKKAKAAGYKIDWNQTVPTNNLDAMMLAASKEAGCNMAATMIIGKMSEDFPKNEAGDRYLLSLEQPIFTNCMRRTGFYDGIFMTPTIDSLEHEILQQIGKKP
jgi:flagellar biosynthesis GTPase FlhF